MKLSLTLIGMVAAGIPQREQRKDGENRAEKFKEAPLVEDEEFGSPEYDGRAVMGDEEYKTFDDLSPEEAKEKLGHLVDKMDSNGDGDVDEKELTMWIHYVQTKYIYDDTERQWEENDKDGDGKLSWDEYKENTYGFLTPEELKSEEDDGFSYEHMLVRDERRWKSADRENKGHLTKEDLTAFLHPEEYDHMKDMVIIETIEDIDRDADGRISLEEYIGDMWHEEDPGEEPDWVEEERRQFRDFRDKDDNGFLENDEVRDWILPSEYDHAENEARHLLDSCDNDGNGSLSKEEIIRNHDIFVGSQATDWGDAIVRHDEF